MSEAHVSGMTPADIPNSAGKRRWLSREALTAWTFSAPAIFLMLVLLIGPVIMVVVISFTDYALGEPEWNWVGFDNYDEMFGDKRFWTSLKNTLIYVAVVVPCSVLLGLGAAILIEGSKLWKSFYRAVYFLPVMSTLVAMAIVWSIVMNPDFGLLNHIVSALGFKRINWLNDGDTALLSICLISIWQAVGFNMVLFLAGLSSIPKDLYDAADLDGAASWWSRFRTVTLPMLGPVMLFVLVITTIRSFQVFDTVHVLTKGGPNYASEVLIYSVYREGFINFLAAYASTITVVFLLFILILTFIKIRFVERKVHYG